MQKSNFRPLKSENSDFLPEEPLGESLLLESAPDIRVWRPKSPVIVLGRSQKAENEINLENSRKDSIPIFQRHGGGGCVVLDPNSVCIGLRYPRENSMNISDFLLHSSKGIQLFLNETYDLNVEVKENYDLLLDNKKFLGASLYMPKGLCLYLAVILMKKEGLSNINKYLTMPSKEPVHRKGRSHSDFLTPLMSHIDCTIESFQSDLQEFMVQMNWTSGP